MFVYASWRRRRRNGDEVRFGGLEKEGKGCCPFFHQGKKKTILFF